MQFKITQIVIIIINEIVKDVCQRHYFIMLTATAGVYAHPNVTNYLVKLVRSWFGLNLVFMVVTSDPFIYDSLVRTF